MRAFLVRMGRLDRRWIYLMIALAVIIPLVFNVVFPVGTTPIVQNIFDKVESLPPGSRIIITSDFSPSRCTSSADTGFRGVINGRLRECCGMP